MIQQQMNENVQNAMISNTFKEKKQSFFPPQEEIEPTQKPDFNVRW